MTNEEDSSRVDRECLSDGPLTASQNELLPLLFETLQAEADVYFALRRELARLHMEKRYRAAIIKAHVDFFVSQGLAVPASYDAVRLSVEKPFASTRAKRSSSSSHSPSLDDQEKTT